MGNPARVLSLYEVVANVASISSITMASNRVKTRLGRARDARTRALAARTASWTVVGWACVATTKRIFWT